MLRPGRARLACAALMLAFTTLAHAGSVTIDLPTALTRAREHAPEALAALARIDEARAQRTGAAVLFTQNPEVQLGAGPRSGDPRTLSIQGQVTQQLEPTRRSARIRVADAGVARAQALDDVQLRELSFEVTNIYYEARSTDLAIEVARRGVDIATRAADAADRRRKAGNITDLDVNLARIALGRARSALAAAQAERADAMGRLGALIGAEPDDVITLAGDLRPAVLTLEMLTSAIPQRADVRAIASESKVARAEGLLANANGLPELGLWLGYERDETDSIIVGGLSFTLPLWNRAQGDKAAARARLRRTEIERAAVISAASRQIVDAFEAYTRAREGVDLFERDVLPTLADSEQLLERSIETGQIAVNDYLVVRQEILTGRREHIERQLQLAKAAAMARFVAGVSP